MPLSYFRLDESERRKRQEIIKTMQMYHYMPKSYFLMFFAVQFSCYSEDLTCPITCHRAPTIVEGPPRILYFNSGSRLTLHCKSSGYPIPRFSWYVNDIELSQKELRMHSHQLKHSNYSSLLILNTKSFNEFNKVYCKARNEEGLAMSNISILTQAVLKEEQLHKSVYNVTVALGRSLVLQCGHVISLPPPSFTWFVVESAKPNLNAQPVQYNEQITMNEKGSLIFTSISKRDVNHERIFKCQAYNYILRKTSAGSYFRILIIPGEFNPYQAPDLIFTSSSIKVMSGENVTLECIFSGLPQPKILWSKENQKLTKYIEKDYGRKIVIPQVTLVDAGIYKCVARNTHGERHSLINVEVGTPPIILSPMANQVGNIGISLIFVCNCSGTPTPTFEWYMNAQNVNESNLPWLSKGNVLILINVQNVLRATITCNASNSHGYILVYAQATVQGKSQSPITTESLFLLSSPSRAEARMKTNTETTDNDSRLLNGSYQNNSISGYYAHSQEHESLPAHSFSVFNIIWLSLFLIFVVFIVIFIYYRSKNRLFTYQVTKVTLRCQDINQPVEFMNQRSSNQ